MKISEYIKLLQNLQNKHGDIEIEITKNMSVMTWALMTLMKLLKSLITTRNVTL